MVEQAGVDVEIRLEIANASIADGDAPDLSRSIVMFKWSSFINNGYQVHARVFDPNLSLFQKLTNIKYLKESRKDPLAIRFSIGYLVGSEEEELRTETRTAYITNLSAKTPSGAHTAGYFEFVAIDPPTWFLSRGDAAGAVYTGNVSEVIKQIIAKYAPGISVDVSETDDSKTNKWYQYRQDPKTFLMTLLDWSASITKNRTNWVVASRDEQIIIKEQAELISHDLGEYSINVAYPGANNASFWEREDNNYLSNIQTRISTAGISAVSGLYCDPTNSITKNLTVVDDDNTSAKKNVRLTVEQGFTKPDDKDFGITMVRAVPENNSGDVGLQYQQYIDGRARNLFVSGLDILNRVKVRVLGSHRFDDSSKLGASVVNLLWTDANGDPWTGNGLHLVHGFEHVFKGGRWHTDIFVNRKDHNSSSRKVQLS